MCSVIRAFCVTSVSYKTNKAMLMLTLKSLNKSKTITTENLGGGKEAYNFV